MNYRADGSISVVIPCYNEGHHLRDSISSLAKFLYESGLNFEIIISDDGSNDATCDIDWVEYKQRYNLKYIRVDPRWGKGNALRRGLQESRGSYVFFTDADLPVNLNAITEGLELLKNNHCDIVMGDRSLRETEILGSASYTRYIVSAIFNIVVRVILLPEFFDTQCCMKGFTRDVLELILPKCYLNSYAIDVEFLYLAKLNGKRILKIPVNWVDVRANWGIGKSLWILGVCLFDVFRLKIMR